MNTFFCPKGMFTGAIMGQTILEREDLSLGAKVLYALLVNCTRNGMDHCWPSQTYLAKSMAVSIRSVQNYVKELSGKGLIEVKRGRYGDSLKYFFVLRSDLGLLSSVPTAQNAPDLAVKKKYVAALIAETSTTYSTSSENSDGKNNTNTPEKFTTNLNYIKNTNPTPLPPVSEKSEVSPCSDFDGGGGIFSSGLEREFWTIFNAYPRKENPAAALRIWVQHQMQGLMPSLETLKSAIEANKRNNPSWSKDGGRYVPYLVNWLRDCRWNDEFSRQDTQEEVAQTQAPGVYEAAESGWCYLKTPGNTRESIQPGSAQDYLDEIDPDFEAIWKACPFEPGPMVVSYGYWKALKKQNRELDAERLLSAVSNAPQDYNRLLWRFLDENASKHI